jgi:hypothetical protein
VTVGDSVPMDSLDPRQHLDELRKRSPVELLAAAFTAGVFASREALASELGVPAECVAVARSLADLTEAAVARVLAQGEVLAVAEPCRESWLHGALAAGGRYLDLGRDHTFRPMDEALGRALSDGRVQAVVIEHPGVLGGETLDLPDDHDPFIFVDQSANPMPEVAVDAGVLHLGRSGGVAWAVGTPDLVADLGELDLPATASSGGRAEVSDMALAVARSGLLHPEPTGVALLVHRPGTLGEALEAALTAAGVPTTRRAHPSWRQAVALAAPDDEDLLSWSRAVGAAVDSLSDAEGAK